MVAELYSNEDTERSWWRRQRRRITLFKSELNKWGDC